MGTHSTCGGAGMIFNMYWMMNSPSSSELPQIWVAPPPPIVSKTKEVEPVPMMREPIIHKTREIKEELLRPK